MLDFESSDESSILSRGTYGSFAGLNDLRKPARGLSSEQCRPNIPVAADQEKWYTLDLCLRGTTYYWSRCCSGFNLLSVGPLTQLDRVIPS